MWEAFLLVILIFGLGGFAFGVAGVVGEEIIRFFKAWPSHNIIQFRFFIVGMLLIATFFGSVFGEWEWIFETDWFLSICWFGGLTLTIGSFLAYFYTSVLRNN